MEDGHCYPFEDVLNRFNVKEDHGLSESQVKENQEKYGPNGEFGGRERKRED